MRPTSSNVPLTIAFSELPQSRIQENNIIIDCRTVEEFELEHVKNAINIPLQHLSVAQDKFPFEKNDLFFIYCRTGNRSLTFATYLRSIGFTKCQSIENGFDSWGDRGVC